MKTTNWLALRGTRSKAGSLYFLAAPGLKVSHRHLAGKTEDAKRATLGEFFKMPDASEATLLVSPPIYCQRPEAAQHQPKHSG